MKLVKKITRDYGLGSPLGLFLLRAFAGFILLYGHGFEKIQTLFSGQEIQFLDPIGIGAKTSFFMAFFAEVIAAVLLIIGLFSRWAALVLIFNFLVILYFHISIANDGFQILELRYFYFFTYLSIFLLGPGRWSIDYLLFKNKEY